MSRAIRFDDGRYMTMEFDHDGSKGILQSFTWTSFNGHVAERNYTYDDNSARIYRWDVLGTKD